jgi:catechol-2,3-dioxygenase
MLGNSPVAAIVPAVDLMRAKKFYQQTLGLEIEREDQTGVTFRCGGCSQLIVYPRSTPTKAEHTAAGWQVDNLEATVRDLKGKNVVFEQYNMPDLKTNALGIAELGRFKSAWFKDTEGNILAINQMS